MAKADGYYFNINGFFYGQEGVSTKVKLCTEKEIHKEIRYNKPIIQTLYKGSIETDIEFEDLIELASIAYAESSIGNGMEIKEEVYALCNAVVNNKVQNKITGDYYNVAIKIKAYVATDGNVQYPKIKSNKSYPEKFNGNFRQQAIAGAINAILYKKIVLEKEVVPGLILIPIDYSNGGTHWDGIDIKTAKWKEGMKFDVGADIWGIGDNKISIKQKFADGKYYEKIYDYKWLSTKGFSKVNKSFKNLKYPYYEGDDKNQNRSGTVLMRTSNEYKSLKYGDKKVEE